MESEEGGENEEARRGARWSWRRSPNAIAEAELGAGGRWAEEEG